MQIFGGGQVYQARMSIPSEPLTGRECQILSLVARGLTNKQIASALEISNGTVQRHVHNILVKLGISNRTEAAYWAIRQGFAKD